MKGKRPLLGQMIWLSTGFGLLTGGVIGFVEASMRIMGQNVLHGVDFVLLYAAVLYGLVGGCLGACLGLLIWTIQAREKLTRNSFLFYGSPILLTAGVLAAVSLHGTLTTPKVDSSSREEFASGTMKARRIESATLQSSSEKLPNILLVVADSLRPDYLSRAGQKQSATPNIDRLAEAGVRYGNTFVQSPSTGASMTSLFTSLLPTVHGMIHSADELPSDVLCLTEILNEGGYLTVGIVANGELDSHFAHGFSNYQFLEPDFPLYASEGASRLALYRLLKAVRQQFGSLSPNHVYRSAEEVTDEALSWISESRSQPFFLYLYYRDTGVPLFRRSFNGESTPGLELVTDKKTEKRWRLYEGEVRYLDEHLGRLFAYLTERGMMDECLVVLTSDRGIGFGERGSRGTQLYDEWIRVPLIFKLPSNRRAGTVSDEIARTLDIAPTILNIIGVTVPTQFQGFSLLNPPSSQGSPTYAISATNQDGLLWLSLRTKSWKLITADAPSHSEPPAVELYDLISDPQEQFNLAPQRQAVVARLYTLLTEGLQGRATSAEAPAPVNIDEATEERLRQLGYIQ